MVTTVIISLQTNFTSRVFKSSFKEEESEKTSEAIGYGAVKYADWKINRLTNYTFNFDQMLNDKENTVVYLQYAHARICSIIRKSEVFVESYSNMLPNVLCEYLYNLASISLNGDLILHNLASRQRTTELKDPNQ
ncbi:hypothetical protein KIW84_043602 [Lathyrus oleraceus]|uniref:Arginyl-tRNA synthetase catalytic core domain-containing protein n=1 Tax=Pisum sativum TaxID=3888 RepID=A0A9D5AUW8_PEA|nr:hypothetical protein KIW84_043602 [Pisum sativum]